MLNTLSHRSGRSCGLAPLFGSTPRRLTTVDSRFFGNDLGQATSVREEPLLFAASCCTHAPPCVALSKWASLPFDARSCRVYRLEDPEDGAVAYRYMPLALFLLETCSEDRSVLRHQTLDREKGAFYGNTIAWERAQQPRVLHSEVGARIPCLREGVQSVAGRRTRLPAAPAVPFGAGIGGPTGVRPTKLH
jgi:hypothetical protein